MATRVRPSSDSLGWCSRAAPTRSARPPTTRPRSGAATASGPGPGTREGRALYAGLRPLMTLAAGSARHPRGVPARPPPPDRRAARAEIERADRPGRRDRRRPLRRGLRFGRRHPELAYVEADLPAMAERKRAALARAGVAHRVAELDAFAASGAGSLTELSPRSTPGAARRSSPRGSQLLPARRRGGPLEADRGRADRASDRPLPRRPHPPRRQRRHLERVFGPRSEPSSAAASTSLREPGDAIARSRPGIRRRCIPRGGGPGSARGAERVPVIEAGVGRGVERLAVPLERGTRHEGLRDRPVRRRKGTPSASSRRRCRAPCASEPSARTTRARERRGPRTRRARCRRVVAHRG